MQKNNANNYLYYSTIITQLGEISILSDNTKLYMLRFSDSCNINNYQKLFSGILNTDIKIIKKDNNINNLTQSQIRDYFDHKITAFDIPLFLSGTDFQNSVWTELRNIPFGQTQNYGQIASKINNPKSFRAVANANANNRIVIIIPCHRVINSTGALGGYSDKIARKKSLIEHEQYR